MRHSTLKVVNSTGGLQLVCALGVNLVRPNQKRSRVDSAALRIESLCYRTSFRRIAPAAPRNPVHIISRVEGSGIACTLIKISL